MFCSKENFIESHCCPKLVSTVACLHEGCLEGRPAVYTLIQCTPLLVEKADVSPDMTLRFTTCNQVSVQARESPWLWNPWGGSHEVQNRGNQWHHKMDLGPTKKFLKKNETSVLKNNSNRSKLEILEIFLSQLNSHCALEQKSLMLCHGFTVSYKCLPWSASTVLPSV